MKLMKKHQKNILNKGCKLLFLISFISTPLLHSAQAASIYQCRQPNGQMAFQQTPCAPSDAQTQIRQTPNTLTTAPQPQRIAPTPTKTETAIPGSSDRQTCNDAGVTVLERKLNHPQAVYQACKKELPGRQNDQACMEACVHTWLRGYEKSLKSQ